MIRIILLASLGPCLALVATAGEPAKFAKPPSVAKAGDHSTGSGPGGVKIEFALSAATDVEVAILDAQGKVVRHLAAGVLGGKVPPPAPLKPGLAQSIEWDGRDDYGQPPPSTLHPQPFSVRVRAGMGTRLDRIVGGDPYAFWSEQSFQGDHAQWGLYGLEAKSDGNVYVLSKITSIGMGPTIRQYDAKGNYRRTVFPPPAGKPVEDVQGWGVNVRADGTFTLKAGYGWSSATPVWTLLSNAGVPRLMPTPVSGTLCVANRCPDGSRQMTIGTDGTLRQFNPEPVFDGDPIPGHGPFFTATTPDGKTRYVSGEFAPPGKSSSNTAEPWRKGQVWKMDVATRKATLFFALDEKDLTPDRTGNCATNPYAAFHGVALDTEGHVFVCDRQNGRVVVLDQAGKVVRSIPAENPDAIAAHPKTKALYVTTRTGNYSGQGELKLLKFGDWSKDDKPMVTTPVRNGLGKFRDSSFLALAQDKNEVFVWVAYTTLPVRVYRDAGAALELVKDFYEAGPQRALDLQHMMVDQKTGDAYVADSQSYCFRVRDWKDPKFELCMVEPKADVSVAGRVIGSPETRLPAASIAIDHKGRMLYALNHYGRPVSRWKMDGECFAPAPVGPSNALTPGITCAWIFEGLGQRGMAAAPGGGLASLGVVLADGGKHTDYSGPLHFFKFDPARTPWLHLKFAGFGGKNLNSGGIRFDPRGNLYVGLCDGKPKDVPAGFDKDKDFSRTTGHIIKYAPTGTGEGGDWFPTEPAAPAKVYDVFYGAFASANRTPRFGVDGHGRIYYPACLLSQVSVIDNEGNPLLSFGTYGNRDSLGGLPGDLVPTKDIPMAWPNSVDADDDFICVSDILNIRLMRLAKTFAAAETVGIK
ncbi:MAG TPA: SMP-30/gluconolactonase/LRE family protein [Planctomycetota bacterium]|nr:SMP-30/gluconolactonase/LRE family protein [Planctomycetota bacterium]